MTVSARAAIRRWTPRPLDIAIAIALLAAVEVDVWVGGVGGPRWVAGVCGAIAAIAVAWRNFAPIGATVVVGITLAVPTFAGVPKEDGTASVFPILFVIFALGQASQRDPSRRLWAYAAIAGTAVLLWSAGVYQEGLGGGDFLYIAAFAVVPYLFGRAVGASRKDSEHHARRADQAVRDREAAREQAVADERLRIARELHDVISHSVSLMGVQAGAARKVLPDGLDDIEATLLSIEMVGRETLDEMRRLLGIMREGTVGAGDRAPQPGIAGIEELVARTRAAGVAVSLSVEGELDDVSPGLDLVAYRIVQEALTNVRRHAPGAAAALRLARRRGELRIEVSNDVPAGAADGPDGHGIIGMRERAALYDGSFTAGVEGGRFVVRCALPIDPVRTAGLAPVEG